MSSSACHVCPIKKAYTCVLDQENGCQVKADVTWTVNGALACVAISLQSQPEVLLLYENGFALKHEDYLFKLESSELQIKFRMVSPGYDVPAQVDAAQEDAGLRPVDASCLRAFARHPNRKVLRARVTTLTSTCGDIVRALFQDMITITSWRVVVQRSYRSETNLVQRFWASGIYKFDIEWGTMAPWRITCINLDRSQCHIGSALFHHVNPGGGCVKRWVRSPFKGKAEVIAIPKDIAVGQLGPSFLAHTRINSSLLCLRGPTILDPITDLESVPETEILSFRLCPLKGGAKQKHGLGDVLTSALLDHGVVKLIRERCDIDKLRPVAEDPVKF